MYKELRRLMKKSEVGEMLCSVPSIGPATAAAFIATIDDPQRFPDSEKVASCLGLVPRVMQSREPFAVPAVAYPIPFCSSQT